MKEFSGMSSAAALPPTGFAASAASGKLRRSRPQKIAVDYDRTGDEADDSRRIPGLG
jgi:hypothetical protein